MQGRVVGQEPVGGLRTDQPPPRSAADLAFERDFRPAVTPDGDFIPPREVGAPETDPHEGSNHEANGHRPPNNEDRHD